ncbi:hypothetical protein BDR04DRAFT_1084399 [Suillus decipiens]|nr:hypothetical protein BDR04DRAFT_1084399 [Suillus decipiens]
MAESAPQLIQGPPAVSSGPLHLRLNCIVLDDDPRCIFAVDIAPTWTVCDLRKAIKDKKKPEFDHVAADRLELWQVNTSFNDPRLLDAIRDKGVELQPLTKLSKAFMDGIECKYIHVIVRCPPVAQHISLAERRLAYLEGAGTLSADPSLGCLYPRSYTNHSQKFAYNETQILGDRLVFFGETLSNVAGKKICIKFVRHYSPEAHEFCGNQGHAPKLITYNQLAGGWNMVIMDALDIDNNLRRSRSHRLLSEIAVSDRQPLKEVITSLIQGLHKHGYVHGDLHATNFVVGDKKQLMLLDFNWAGPIEKTYYPMFVNRKDIRRPDGAWDGQKIAPQHDLDMLDYLFHSEQDDREPAAKRRRTSVKGRQWPFDPFMICCITKSPFCLIRVCFVFHKVIIQ